MKERIEIHYTEGKQLYREGRYRDAEEKFEKVISIDPEHRGARGYLLITREAMKDRAEKYYERGMYFKKQNHYVDALHEFLTAQKKDPGYKDTDQQIRSLRTTDQIRSEFTTMYEYAKKLHLKKKYKSAYNYCLKAEKYDPHSIELITLKTRVRIALDQKSSEVTNRAEDLYNQEKYTQAGNLAARALKLNPWDTNAKEIRKNANQSMRLNGMYAKAENYYRKGDYFTAYKIFRRIELKEPGFLDTGNYLSTIKSRIRKNIDTYYNRGMRYYESERYQQAIDQWDRVLLVDPDHEKAREYRERAMAKLEIQGSLEND